MIGGVGRGFNDKLTYHDLMMGSECKVTGGVSGFSEEILILGEKIGARLLARRRVFLVHTVVLRVADPLLDLFLDHFAAVSYRSIFHEQDNHPRDQGV